MSYTTLSLATDGRLARLTLQRPERLNAINREMPRELAAAVAEANAAAGVHVIVLAGAGRAFCAGYDLEWGTRVEAEADAAATTWDPMRDLIAMSENVAWRTEAVERGIKAALAGRDRPFGDYGSRPKR